MPAAARGGPAASNRPMRISTARRFILLHKPVDCLHEFIDLPRPVAPRNGIADAVVDVAPHHLQGHLVQRFAGGRHLLDDVDAVAAFLDHAGDPADLAFAPPQAGQDGIMFRIAQHWDTYTTWEYM